MIDQRVPPTKILQVVAVWRLKERPNREPDLHGSARRLIAAPPAQLLPHSFPHPWPKAAFGDAENGRFAADLTTWPVANKQTSLEDFLRYEPKELSHRAATGFERRFSASSLRAPDEFRAALLTHIARMAQAGKQATA